MSQTIANEDVTVRDLQESDIPFVLDYWYRSPPGFIEAMGVDLAKMRTESEMRTGLTQKIRDNLRLPKSSLNALAIIHRGEAIGFHVLNPLFENDYGIFHAHLWAPDFRRRGVGSRSYPHACRMFIERFNLRRVLFKTPLQNVGAIRTKEKLGIRSIGEETIGFGIIREGTLARVFELTREEASRL